MIDMKDLFDSVVRSVVPYLVGGALSWVTSLGLEIDPQFEGSLTAALTLFFGTVYYIVVRALEVYVAPKFGWLLGLAKTPIYVKMEAPIADSDLTIFQATLHKGEYVVDGDTVRKIGSKDAGGDRG